MPTGRSNFDGSPNRGGGGIRKSTAELMKSGTLKHDPQKYADRLKEPNAGLRPLSDPPKYFDKEHRQAWFEVINTCHPGTVFEEDRFAVEEFAKVRVAMRNAKNVTPATYTRFFQFLKLFGLSPADRSRVSVKTDLTDDNNPFDGFSN